MSENIYRYRVGKKWLSFDKSRLEPEDLRIFELADWKDKLNIITIYNDLKPVAEDSVIVLKSKKENANKDKRATEYRKRRDELNNKITDINEKHPTTEVEREKFNQEVEQLQKQLKDLDIEYADIVNIQNAENVNIGTTQTLTLKNVKTVIDNTNKKVKELEKNLSAQDIQTIKDNLSEILNSKSKEELKQTIDAIHNNLSEISKNTVSEVVQKNINSLTTQIDELKKSMNAVKQNALLDFIIEINKNINKDSAIVSKYTTANQFASEYDITEADMNTINSHQAAFDFVKKYPNYTHRVAEYIRIYEYIKQLENKSINYVSAIFKELVKEKPNINNSYFDLNKDETEFTNLFNQFLFNGGIETPLFVYGSNSKNGKDPAKIQYMLQNKFNIYTEEKKESEDMLKQIKEFVDSSPRQAEEEKPGAVEVEQQEVEQTDGGFLGLRTNKRAKQDFDKLIGEIEALKSDVKQLKEELNRVKTTKPDYINELTKPQQLRHVEQTKPSYSVDSLADDLANVLKNRRADIEISEDTDDEGDVWADGLITKGARTESYKLGGLLKELQRDLQKYGLMLTRSGDNKAMFVNVFERKDKPDRKASGIEEAKEIVYKTKPSTKYTELKKLYEKLYE